MVTKKAKNAIITFIVIIAIMLSVLLFIYTKSQTPPILNNSQILYFYGDTCPNCKEVEKFMQENNITERLSIPLIEKEVYNNQDNQKELISYAEKCGLNKNYLGVPFIYHNNKCYMGRDDVIDFLNSQLNL